MKKPVDDNSPGWFEDPEVENLERYWNGKYWSKHTRIPGEINPDLTATSDFRLGKFLFRSPIKEDVLFKAYLIISAVSLLFSLKAEFDITGSKYLIFYIFIAPYYFFIVYFWFLLILVPRRIKDKKKGMQKDSVEVYGDSVGFLKKNRTYLLIGAAVIISLLAFPLAKNRQSEGDKFFAVEQKISAVIAEWNQAATPISNAIQGVSNGTTSIEDARIILSQTSTNFANIHNKLANECSAIPDYDLNATGINGAYAKVWHALKVNCDYLPQESTEVLALLNEQISPIGTQEKINYHQSEISKIIELRKSVMIEGLQSLRPYGTDAEKQNIDRVLAVFN